MKLAGEVKWDLLRVCKQFLFNLLNFWKFFITDLSYPSIVLGAHKYPNLGLQQIREHFYYTNGGHLYSISGAGFAVAPSIKKLGNLWVTQNYTGVK